MRIAKSLVFLLCFSSFSAAQANKVQQPSTSLKVKWVTVKRDANLPPDANCTPGLLTVPTNVPSSGGSYTASYTFTVGAACGSPILQSRSARN